MTRDDIIRMAREAGFYVGTNLSGVELVCHQYQYLNGNVHVHLDVEDLQKFARLVLATELDRCARLCETDWRRCGALRRHTRTGGEA